MNSKGKWGVIDPTEIGSIWTVIIIDINGIIYCEKTNSKIMRPENSIEDESRNSIYVIFFIVISN